MFGWPRKSRSTSGLAGAQEYWWLSLMDFGSFFVSYVFEVKESIFGSFTKIPCLCDLENPGQLPVLQVLEGTDDWVLWIFVIFSIFYVFEIKQSIFGSSTELPCSGDIKNLGKLPVLQVLEGTGDWVSRLFVIPSFSTFSMSKNSFFTVLWSQRVKKTSKIQLNLRFHRYSSVLMIGSYRSSW